MVPMLPLKAVYRRRRSYKLGVIMLCALGGCSRLRIVFVFFAYEYRFWLEALLGGLWFDEASFAASLLLSCPSLTMLRA